MQATEQSVRKAMSAIIEALDAAGKNQSPATAQRRGESRRQLRAACELWLFKNLSPIRAGKNVVTRNLSFRGLSVVGALNDPVRVGQPIEAVLAMPDATPSHVAGTVAFCRRVDCDCFEVGLNVEAVGSDWILARDVESAMKRYEWFTNALRVPDAAQ